MELIIPILFSLVVLASCLFVAIFAKKWDLSIFISVSAGGLLTIAILEFLPESFSHSDMHEHLHDSHAPLLILSGILVQGFLEAYVLPRLGFLDKLIDTKCDHNHHHSHFLSPGSVCSAVGCLSICSFFDGIRFFAALNIGESVAWATGLALFFHLLSEGAFVAIMGLGSKIKLKVIMVLSFFISGTFIIGSVFANYFAKSFESHNLIAFATGILLYVCFMHLIPFSLKGKGRLWFFIGLVGFYLLHLFGH